MAKTEYNNDAALFKVVTIRETLKAYNFMEALEGEVIESSFWVPASTVIQQTYTGEEYHVTELFEDLPVLEVWIACWVLAKNGVSYDDKEVMDRNKLKERIAEEIRGMPQPVANPESKLLEDYPDDGFDDIPF